MSPRIILIVCLALLVGLGAATLIYYLPKLQAHEAVAITASTIENEKPDVDQLLTELSPPADPAGFLPPPQPQTDNPQSQAVSPRAPVDSHIAVRDDAAFIALLKNPPIQFETKSATLTSVSRNYLSRVATLLLRQQNVRLRIDGHTDNQNRLGNNQELSTERARSVRDYLVGAGVAADRFDVTGHGGSRPVADNSTAEGRAKNRRIELNILQ